MTPLQHYRDSVTNAPAGYQQLEGLLKLYAETYYDAVRAFVDEDLFFDFHRKDIEDAPLGRLITVFSRTCGNKKLAHDLRELKSHRDQVAHQALLFTYEDTSDEKYREMIEENHFKRSADCILPFFKRLGMSVKNGRRSWPKRLALTCV